MGKPEISIGKSKGSRHLVWEGFRKYGLCFEVMQFFHSFQSVQLIWIYFVASRSPSTSNFILLCSCTKFPPNINTYFSLRAKFWRRRWVGRQFPRNVRWSEVEDQNKQTNKPGEDSNHCQKWPQCQQLVNSAQGLLLVCSARRWSMASP